MHEDELGRYGLFTSHAFLFRLIHNKKMLEAFQTYDYFTVFMIAPYGMTEFGSEIKTAYIALHCHYKSFMFFQSLHNLGYQILFAIEM